jgi:SPX domain protein involved in polyphosphate accumulation
MKFGENLQGHITSEWRTQYIDYERLKEILYEFKESAPCPDSVDETEIARHFKNGSECFFQEIEKELQKVNLFFGEKLNEAARRFTQLKK